MKLARTATALAFLAISISAFAADLSGNWTGKLKVDRKEMEKMFDAQAGKATAEQKKQMAGFKAMAMQQLTAVEQASFKAVLKKDGTYTMVTPAMMGQKSQTESGKWTLKGNVITMTSNSAAAKKQGMTSQVGKVSADGKTMTFDMSAAAKARSGGKAPSTIMTFTRG